MRKLVMAVMTVAGLGLGTAAAVGAVTYAAEK